jgi:hypothetical protein
MRSMHVVRSGVFDEEAWSAIAAASSEGSSAA